MFLPLNPTIIQPFYYLIVAVLVDTLLGISVAIKNSCKKKILGKFSFQYLPNFLFSQVLAHLFPLAILATACHLRIEGVEVFYALYTAGVAAYSAALLSQLREKMAILFGLKESKGRVVVL